MTIKVILADDAQIVRQGLRTLLASEPDIQVVGEADDGRKTLKLAQELAPDVIIMDISMPDLNGFEATRQLLVGSPGAKVIALSMHSDSLFVSNMLRSGALGYLLKDCALEELVKAIRTVMRRQTYVSPGVSDSLIQDLASNCAAGSSSAYSVLSAPERQVLQLLAEGKGTRQIAASLGLSSKTIEAHHQQIVGKLGLSSVAELTKYAIRQGLASLDE